MLIYDSFPNLWRAKEFAGRLNEVHWRKAIVCRSQGESNAIDPFPFELQPPIVLVERGDIGSPPEDYAERAIGAWARQCGGKFAGT